MKARKEITSEETLSFLEKIMNRKLLISNPCRMDVPGLGEMVATSMVLIGRSEKDKFGLYPYFYFQQSKLKGTIFRINNKYFLEYEGGISQ